MFNVPAAVERLKRLGITEFRFLAETGSTNDDALTWAEQGAADGSAGGRGYADLRARAPGSPLGDCTWVGVGVSLILRPSPAEAAQAGLFAGLGAVAVAEALEQGWSLKPQIKWPNDVLLGGQKVCGILAEAAWSGSQLQAVVLGIGVNVAPVLCTLGKKNCCFQPPASKQQRDERWSARMCWSGSWSGFFSGARLWAVRNFWMPGTGDWLFAAKPYKLSCQDIIYLEK